MFKTLLMLVALNTTPQGGTQAAVAECLYGVDARVVGWVVICEVTNAYTQKRTIDHTILQLRYLKLFRTMRRHPFKDPFKTHVSTRG